MLIEQILIYVLFAAALLVNLLAEARDNDIARYYTKPLLIPMIMAYYMIIDRETDLLIVIALLLAFFGDVFLLFERSNFLYRVGFFSFFLCYLFFAAHIALSLDLAHMPLKSILWPVIPAALPILICLGIVWKSLKDARIFMLIYSSIGIILWYFCWLRVGQVPLHQALPPILGCVLFLVSDLMIGWSRFKQDFKYSGVYIMLTYAFAMVLMVVGFMEPVFR